MKPGSRGGAMDDEMSWREVTALVVLLLPVAVGAFDYCVYVFGDNSATISRTFLDWSLSKPYRLIGAFAVVFTAGLFFGHVFLAQHVSAQNYPTLARLFHK